MEMEINGRTTSWQAACLLPKYASLLPRIADNPGGNWSASPPPASSMAHKHSRSPSVSFIWARASLAAIKLSQISSKISFPLGRSSMLNFRPLDKTISPLLRDLSTVSNMVRAGSPIQSSTGISRTQSLDSGGKKNEHLRQSSLIPQSCRVWKRQNPQNHLQESRVIQPSSIASLPSRIICRAKEFQASST